MPNGLSGFIDRSEDTLQNLKADFIIVGAGSAGSVLAERLTANGRYSVLLLEAGGDDRRFFVQMPLGYGELFYDRAVNWGYLTEADPGLAGRQDYWPRGKLLGGSSSVNAMVYIRGHQADYDEWRASGNIGWGWDDVLPAFRAIEDNEAGENAYRGKGGPLFISANKKDLHPLVENFLAASKECGLPYNPDFNGLNQEGVGYYQMTIKGRRRNSTARAFLRPAMARKNLRVLKYAHVTKVLFSEGRAIGVEFASRGQTYQAHCAKEVVLSGGAVNSPQILQLSGIGPGANLTDLGITPMIDNPNVGAHLSDHQGINYTYEMMVPTYNNILRPWWGKLKVGIEYLLLGRGPLAKSINHAGGFFRSHPDLARPNMQLYFQAFSTVMPKPGQRPILTPDPFSGLSIGLSNCRPTSTGKITLASADPLVAPRIHANVFANDQDVAEMLDAVKFLRKIAAAGPMAKFIKQELRPGPMVTSDANLIADFRERSGTVYHPACSCRMGPDAASAVIDARLRVHGVGGLRVVDASSFPNQISGNLNGPTMMLAWKAAQIMLEDHAAL